MRGVPSKDRRPQAITQRPRDIEGVFVKVIILSYDKRGPYILRDDVVILRLLFM
jgi:hypothetical protein